METVFRNHRLAYVVVAASFGPYVLMGLGLRTEHALIYGLLPLAVLMLPFRQRSILTYPPLAAILALLVFATVWTLLVTLLGPAHFESRGKAIAHFENYLQPIAVLLVLAAFVRAPDLRSSVALFQGVCRILIVMLLLNTAVAVASIFVDLSGPISWFVGVPAEGGYTVWQLAALMGRFSGIFNQPMESGLTYSLGLFAWGYLARQRSALSYRHYLALATLVVGGSLSISKVFILGGFPLFLLYWLSFSRLRQLFSMRLGAILLAAVGAAILLLQQWKGLGFLLLLFLPSGGGDRNLLSLYTAGRFGEEETLVKGLFVRVWQEAPFQGLGFASETTLDNAYAEFLVQGGMVALLAYLAILGVMGMVGLQQWMLRREEGRLLLCCAIFITAAGIGAPVLTINRFSTVFWVFLASLCFVVDARRRAEAATRPAVNPAPVLRPSPA